MTLIYLFDVENWRTGGDLKQRKKDMISVNYHTLPKNIPNIYRALKHKNITLNRHTVPVSS
jgi:hypothetical protein